MAVVRKGLDGDGRFLVGGVIRGIPEPSAARKIPASEVFGIALKRTGDGIKAALCAMEAVAAGWAFDDRPHVAVMNVYRFPDGAPVALEELTQDARHDGRDVFGTAGAVLGEGA